MEEQKDEHCLTVWVDTKLRDSFAREVEKLGMNRSQVMRQLIKRWLIQRKAAGLKEPIEELV
jgi:antitoxin component of RelBE/YafQ-DinJ toxin-antitoxin module